MRRKVLPSRVSDDLDLQFARAGTVEFREKDGLPPAKRETAMLDIDRFRRADERGLDVRIGISFGMGIAGAMWDEAVENGFDISSDGGVITFIDEDTGGGMRNINMTYTAGAARFADSLLDLRCDVLQFCAARCADV